MRRVHEEWTPAEIFLHYTCKCGGYEIISA